MERKIGNYKGFLKCILKCILRCIEKYVESHRLKLMLGFAAEYMEKTKKKTETKYVFSPFILP